MGKGVIYLYTFPNGKVYVGQTRRNPEIRHREHFDPKTGPLNRSFWEAYQEQGKPRYEIIEELCSDDAEELVHKLNSRETFYIDYYKAINPEYGYNVKSAGTESLRHDHRICKLYKHFRSQFMDIVWPDFVSLKEKIDDEAAWTEGERQLYQTYFVDLNPFVESAKTDEFMYEEWFDFAQFCLEEDISTMAEEYMRENGAQLLEEYYDENTIYQLSLDGQIVKSHASQYAAAMAMGAKTSANINNVILCKQKTAYGFKWIKAIDYHKDN